MSTFMKHIFILQNFDCKTAFTIESRQEKNKFYPNVREVFVFPWK